MLPPPRRFFQSIAPLLRSIHQSCKSSPSAVFRKMKSPQTIGVEPLKAGIASFQVRPASALPFIGRFFSLLVPFKLGPRHCAQFSANDRLIDHSVMKSAKRIRLTTIYLRMKASCFGKNRLTAKTPGTHSLLNFFLAFLPFNG